MNMTHVKTNATSDKSLNGGTSTWATGTSNISNVQAAKSIKSIQASRRRKCWCICARMSRSRTRRVADEEQVGEQALTSAQPIGSTTHEYSDEVPVMLAPIEYSASEGKTASKSRKSPPMRM